MGQHTKNRLTDLRVRHAKDGAHGDGGNLHLRVSNGGKSRKWVLRYQRDGKVVEIGLGPVRSVPLKLARELRDRHLETLAKGGDPRTEKAKQATARRGRKTFGEAAVEVIAARQAKWRANANDGRTSSRDDWTKSLTVACKPISARPVDEITTGDIEPIIKRHWDSGQAASMRRLLTRIEAVFNYAKAHGWRKADNPASWAIFQHRLQADGPTGPKANHPALEWRDAPAFMARLRALADPSMAALALEMTILTACRSGEVRGMRWTEIDFDAATWTIPAERMKRAVEHQVPLSDDAVALLRRLEAARIGKFVFPGRRSSGPVTNWPVWAVVQRLTERADGQPSVASPHGFRASFRSWTAFQRIDFELAEACLAHKIGNDVSKRYNREDFLELRRPIMERWASFLSDETIGKIVAFGGRRKRL